MMHWSHTHNAASHWSMTHWTWTTNAASKLMETIKKTEEAFALGLIQNIKIKSTWLKSIYLFDASLIFSVKSCNFGVLCVTQFKHNHEHKHTFHSYYIFSVLLYPSAMQDTSYWNVQQHIDKAMLCKCTSVSSHISATENLPQCWQAPTCAMYGCVCVFYFSVCLYNTCYSVPRQMHNKKSELFSKKMKLWNEMFIIV